MILGTVVNTALIVAGSAVGLAITHIGRNKVKSASNSGDKISDSVMKILGLTVAVVGIRMAIGDHDMLSAIVCMAAGTLLGEFLKIEQMIEHFGTWLKKVIKSDSGTFVEGFVSASILYGVGAMAILGGLTDGLSNDPSILYIKSVMDGIFSVILAGTLGIGVLFSAIPIFIYQCAISLGASKLTFLMENSIYTNGISIVGGIIVMAIGLNITGITKFRTGNMLPAILLIVIYDAVYLYFQNNM